MSNLNLNDDSYDSTRVEMKDAMALVRLLSSSGYDVDQNEARTPLEMVDYILNSGPVKLRELPPNFRYIEKEDELEKLCSRCRDWWPASPEFFGYAAERRLNLRSYCKACDLDRASEEVEKKGRKRVRRLAYGEEED